MGQNNLYACTCFKEMGPLDVNCKFFAGHVGLLQFD